MSQIRSRAARSSQSWFGSIMQGVLVGVFFGFLFVAGIFLVVREGYARIDTIVVSGNTVVPDSVVLAVVRDALSEDCFVHVVCGYTLWLPVEYIERYLVASVPRIKSASITVNANNSISVAVNERDLYMRYCLDFENTTCYLVDSGGVLYGRAPRVTDVRFLPTVVPDSDKIFVDIVGQSMPLQLWGTVDMRRFNTLVDLVGAHARLYRVVYTRRDIIVEIDRLYDYSLVADTAHLKFNWESLDDPEAVMYMSASLDRLKTFQPFVDKFQLYPRDLEYLDLRFPKRLYMKFADQAVVGDGQSGGIAE